jgi:MATE family multidrug resistance protein
MFFVDRLFLMWHSSAEMAATLPSGNLLWTLIALPLGIAAYVNSFVAQYHGAGQQRRIGVIVRHGVGFGWLVTPVFLALIPLATWLFQSLGHDAELARHESLYFQINCFGAGAAVIAAAYSCFFTGRGQTTTVMWIDVAASVLDGVLNYFWIFGKAGFPEMGLAGAAWSSVVGQWFKIAVYWWLLRRPDIRSEFGFDQPLVLDRVLMRRLFRFGAPSGFQMQLEGIAFTVFVLEIGRFGTMATAATTLAISINVVAFVPMVGLGIAVSTLVGNYLGANRPHLAARATWSGLSLALAYNAVFAALYWGAPNLFLMAHQQGANDPNFESIRDLSIVLLRFVAAYCLFDAMQLTFCSAIKGAGDTRFVLLTTIATSAGAVALGHLGVWSQGWGTLWWWTVLMIWILALAAAYGFRFWQGKWKLMRVIENVATDIGVDAAPQSAAVPQPAMSLPGSD